MKKRIPFHSLATMGGNETSLGREEMYYDLRESIMNRFHKNIDGSVPPWVNWVILDMLGAR